MQPAPTITVNKHSITVTPQLVDLTLAYTRFFIYEGRRKIDEYFKEIDRLHEHLPSEDHEISEWAITTQKEIRRAESILHDLERLQQELERIYELNFETIAEVLRLVRIHMKIDDWYTMYSLRITVETFAQILKEENSYFDRKKFYDYINSKGD